MATACRVKLCAWASDMRLLYLASQSPRRCELLAQIGIAHQVLSLHHPGVADFSVDETPHPGETPEAYVQRVCLEKARAGLAMRAARQLPDAPVLAADTSVILDGEILGKPDDDAHAAAMLRRLSGREHQVMTAIAVGYQDQLLLALSTSRVTFATLDDAAIAAYLASGEQRDKAGSYGIQGRAAAFITRLDGSYSGVMGLPLYETAALLRQIGWVAAL